MSDEPTPWGRAKRSPTPIPDLRRLDPFGFSIRGYRPGSPRTVALTPPVPGPVAAAGRTKPIDQNAYRALESLHRGRWSGQAGIETWIKAFTTVGWLVAGDDGPVLTDAGLRGLRDLMRRKSQGSRLRMHDDHVARSRPVTD